MRNLGKAESKPNADDGWTMVQPKTRHVRFPTSNLIKGIGITKVIEDKTNAFTTLMVKGLGNATGTNKREWLK